MKNKGLYLHSCFYSYAVAEFERENIRVQTM